MSLTEQQLSAMIDAAVREAVDRTTRELTAKFEAETAGLRRNRDDLLAEKKDAEGKKPWQAALDKADAMLARMDETLRRSREMDERQSASRENPSLPSSLQRREITISRDDARNGAKYREAKEAAERAGVPLRIVDDAAPTPRPTASQVRFLRDDTAGVLYANRELVAEVGLTRLNELAAQQNSRLTVFRSVDDLPEPMRRRHAEVIASGDRDALLDGGSQ